MRSITGTLTPTLARHVGDAAVARAPACPIRTFRALAEQVAQLSYLNKDHLLFFRGQSHDFLNKAGRTTAYPSIYRGERVTREQLDLAFTVLEAAARRLCEALQANGNANHAEVRRRRLVQWSILQHYEVCATPLLDLTQSLRVACSFAFQGGKPSPCILVFGLPYFTNRISVNSEHELVNVRLLSISPPEALRAHFQEGYLAGTEDVTTDYDSKSELDFNNRLIAKFSLPADPRKFWRDGFRPFPKKVLYEVTPEVDPAITGDPRYLLRTPNLIRQVVE